MSEQAATTTTDAEMNIEVLAGVAAACFETAYRNDDPEARYTRLKDDSPEWVTDLVRSAHSSFGSLMLPDDWRYDCISAACDAIADGLDADDGSHEFADGQVDIYNAARLAWLASGYERPSYVDQARDEGLTGPDTDTLEAIGMGQYVEALEVFSSVWQSLESRLDEDDDQDED